MRGQLQHGARKEKNPPGEKRTIFSHFLQKNSDTTKIRLHPSISSRNSRVDNVTAPMESSIREQDVGRT
jgi:hypothetical protein